MPTASQVSAVIDAAGGNSLVIQGPPGTGKSQTITNIIANAMWQGQSVLFVSEKMAALNVVKDRLDHMGLGAFCLEVHSAKASKAQVLKSLKERMEADRVRSNAAEIEQALEALKATRQKLTDYVRVINSAAGATGLVTHDILWGDATRGDRLEGVPSDALEFRIKEPLLINRFKLDELKAICTALDQHASAMGLFAEPARQPWRGINNALLTRFDRAAAIEAVSEWSRALGELQHSIDALNTETSWTRLSSINDALQAIDTVHSIPFADGVIETVLLSLTAEDSCIHALTRWSDAALRADELETLIATVCPFENLAARHTETAALLGFSGKLGIDDSMVSDLPALRDQAFNMADLLKRASELIARVRTLLKTPEVANAEDEILAANFLYCASYFPHAHAHLRSGRLADDGVLEDIAEAQRIAADITAAAQEARFSEPATPILAHALPSSFELRAAAGIIQTSGLFGRWFGRDFRQARAIWMRAFPGEKIQPDSATRLRAAAQWKDSLQRLDQCQNAKDAIGRHWKNESTPFAAIGELASWMRATRKYLPLKITGAQELRQILLIALGRHPHLCGSRERGRKFKPPRTSPKLAMPSKQRFRTRRLKKSHALTVSTSCCADSANSAPRRRRPCDSFRRPLMPSTKHKLAAQQWKMSPS